LGEEVGAEDTFFSHGGVEFGGGRIGFGGVATDCRAIGAVVERKKELGMRQN
jgi:hypothetical protein